MELGFRFDRGSLRSPRVTPQGFLRVDGYATRVGVLEYVDPSYPSGIRRELRLPEDLFDAESLATYDGAPVTDDHPPELVTSTNVRAFQRGTSMAAARRDGDHVAVDLLLTDAKLIEKVHAGKVELSSGYRVRIDRTPGVHPIYGSYDCRQRDIRINHVAIVDVGRSGPTSRVRMDSASLVSCCAQVTAQLHDVSTSSPLRGDRMPDPTDIPVQLQRALDLAATERVRADSYQAQVAGLTERADKAEGQVTVLQAEIAQLRTERRDDNQIASLQAEIAAHKERADKAEAAVAAVPAKIAAGIRARVDIERDASRVLGAEVNFDAMTDREIMTATLEKCGIAIESDRTDAMVLGAFKSAVAMRAASMAAWRQVQAETRTPDTNAARADTGSSAGLSPREAMIRRNRGLPT